MIRNEQPSPVKLRTKEQFNASMAEKAPQLDRYPKNRRRKILDGLYRIARERAKNEAERLEAITRVSEYVRPRLVLYRRARIAMREAHKFLVKTEKIYARRPKPSRRPPWITMVEEAKTKVSEAMYSLKVTMSLLAAEMHPNLVKKEEKKEYDRLLTFVIEAETDTLVDGKMPPEFELASAIETYFDHVRSSVATHWFVLDTDSYLKKQKMAQPIDRYRLIQAVFAAAFGEFGEHVEEQMVRTIARRHAEKLKSVF